MTSLSELSLGSSRREFTGGRGPDGSQGYTVSRHLLVPLRCLGSKTKLSDTKTRLGEEGMSPRSKYSVLLPWCTGVSGWVIV